MIKRAAEFVKNNKIGVIVSIFTLMIGVTALLIFARILAKI
ncbi:hypothetical protein ASZ90_019124 [hydrocarbon metagenome]|uniref:Uncharacterized protein n=1 Tax=hydrocarbon metagenome TaxID=938273 RepID=A0A0W8E4A0_9ZZZZ